VPPKGDFHVTVDAPPEVVWPWIASLERHVEWSPKPYKVEWISGEPNAIGSRYRSTGSIPMDKHHVNEGEITERVDQRRFALRADDPQGPFRNTYELRPVDGGTDVMHRLEFPKMKPWIAPMAALLFATSGKPELRKRMQLLKQRVEAAR
jgi:uncharacterized protein YndB with AHSA1/START domain